MNRDEPRFAINGFAITMAEAMTIRVAIESFANDLQHGLGDDETGKKTRDGYLAAIDKIRRRMYEGFPAS